MNQRQLKQIENFTKKYYTKTGKFHAWDHIELVKKSALELSKDFKDINKNLLLASVFIHDIGRSIEDEGHPAQSVKIAIPFLKKIGLKKEEVEIISDAVSSHDKDKIKKSKTNEAKVLFDADKLQILTIFGFFRVCFWLTDERKMEMSNAINFLWKYCQDVRKNYLQTKLARKIVDKEFPTLKNVIKLFNDWQE